MTGDSSMSPHIHPKALGRILSQIFFGSTLNIAASLANPALPAIGVRGVYAKEMILPVAQVMREIGYKSAIVLHGCMDDSPLGMDEASICGITHCARVSEETIHEFSIDPKKLGLATKDTQALSPEPELTLESKRFAALINNKESGASYIRVTDCFTTSLYNTKRCIRNRQIHYKTEQHCSPKS